jgi:hypothetical protein
MRPSVFAAKPGRLALTRVLGERIRLQARGQSVELELVDVNDRTAALRLVSRGFLPFEIRLPMGGAAVCLLPLQGHMVRVSLSNNQPRGSGRVRLIFEAPSTVQIDRAELPPRPLSRGRRVEPKGARPSRLSKTA